MRPSAWAWPRAPTQTRTPTTAIAAAATTVTPYRRLLGPENPRPPDSGEPGPPGEPGEPGGCRPMRIWLAEFRSVVMALPSLMCVLSCHNHCRRYFSRPLEENSLFAGRAFSPVFWARVFRPGSFAPVSLPAGPSGPGIKAPALSGLTRFNTLCGGAAVLRRLHQHARHRSPLTLNAGRSASVSVLVARLAGRVN